MASKLYFLIPISISILLSISIPPSFADNSIKSICKSTPDPSYCKSVLLQSNNQTANIYYYGRSAVRKSLSQARKFLNLIDKHLRHKSSLTLSAIRALEDCRLLAGLNLDFLLTSFQTVNTTDKLLPIYTAEDVQTLLSAILTNQLTCLDGLQSTASSWNLKNGLSVPLKNDTKLYSVSLALFKNGWVPKSTKKVKQHQVLHHRKELKLRMSSKNRAVFEKMKSRRMLQDDGDDDYVMVSDIVTVSLDGSGDYGSIGDAIGAAPNNSNGVDGYFLIYVMAGVYEEYVSVPKNKKYLMMIGDGINQTVITGNRSVIDGWTTFNSATFAVVSPNFVMANITIRNTAGAIKHQAVALRAGADLSAFYSCSFEAYQDTLYAHSLRQFYRECDIYGTVDFIFGNAAAVFQNCNLYPRLPMSGQFNAITAQGRTDPNQNTGTSIHNCTIKAAGDLVSSNYSAQTYLGRPWKEYSRTVYMQTFMDKSIHPSGWHIWDGDFALNTSYYAEFNNSGPGSNTSGRVTWIGFHLINVTNAANFTVSNFLLGDDWLPPSGVPYAGGLL